MERYEMEMLGKLFPLFRRLKSTVKRWPHQERLDPNEPMGCGFPVCAMVDMKPIRFQSLCNFTGWMRQEGHVRRIIEVQKGGCEDASKQ